MFWSHNRLFTFSFALLCSRRHLAASVVAAFAKRLAQLALISPMRLTPALLLLIRNALRRHLKCSVLVNRHNRPNLTVNSSKQPTSLSSADPYQWDPRNLESCGALESSLWEVASLIHHYSLAVSSLAYEICNPNPANAATWEGLSPSDLIHQQDSSDLPSSTEASVPPTWSRAVSRTMLGLVHKGGLHYPRLYPRLYELLDDSLLECPEVGRFLDDMDIYLSSLHLAASVVAAFAKRLAQLALISPMRLTPALLLLIRNALRRHLKCSVLVNRHNRPNLTVNSSKQPTSLSSADPYQWDPRNLESCGALESSLWEVASLIHHYSLAVSSLAYEICNPNPANAATWEGLSPSDLIHQQDSEINRCVDSIHQSLLSLTKSNVSIPELPVLEGWSS
ncbi:hypothetical protein AHF37_10419 [Paragonimus kellicotti]|nr:hypothetical protein AHF37_10419 [Paragonimus kellicotti]